MSYVKKILASALLAAAGAALVSGPEIDVAALIGRPINTKIYYTEKRHSERYLLDKAYSDGNVTLFVHGEFHAVHNGSPEAVRKNNPEIVFVEGLCGLVDDEMMSKIREDRSLVEKVESLAKQPDSVLLFGAGVITPEGITYNIRHDRAFLGAAPGIAITNEMYGQLPIFGYENMGLYDKINCAIKQKDLEVRTDGLRKDLCHIIRMPSQIEENLPKICDELDREIQALDNPLCHIPEDTFDRITILDRSRIAVRNSLHYMKINGYKRGSFVIGWQHLPSVYEALEARGFREVHIGK